ncbi:MAG: hypothetical protein PHF35_05135 [Candidatus Moranbacteria bacterium]|nr:hypothetical protein [Candidatus Moranbacteria bacterium]
MKVKADGAKKLVTALIGAIGADGIKLVMKARKAAYQEKELFLANLLDTYVFQEFSGSPHLLDELMENDFMAEQSIQFTQKSFDYLNAKRRSIPIIFKLIEIALRLEDYPVVQKLSADLLEHRNFGPVQMRKKIGRLISRKDYALARVFTEALLSQDSNNMELLKLSCLINYQLGDYFKFKSAFFKVQDRLSQTKIRQMTAQLNELKKISSLPEQEVRLRMRTGTFWNNVGSLVPADRQAAIVAGYKPIK